MYQQWKNNAFSKLAVALNTTHTTLTVESSHGVRFPTIVSPQYFYLTLQDTANNIEIVKVIDRVGDLFTVQRAQEGTTARDWPVGTIVELRITAAALSNLVTLSDPEILANKTINLTDNTLITTLAQLNNAISDGDVQPADPTLSALASVNTTANSLIYAIGPDAFATTPLTAAARSLLDDTDTAAMRGTLSAAKSGANSDITSLTGLTTPLSVSQGGTGQTTTVAAANALLDSIGSQVGDILYRSDSGWQKLPKGTAGQVLQMNSGATAPEWQTVTPPSTPSGLRLGVSVFNTPGAWSLSLNPMCKHVHIIVNGAGGGFYSYSSGDGSGTFSPGGNGGRAERFFAPVGTHTVLSGVVGSGGTSYRSFITGSNPATSGGASTCTQLSITAYGGAAGGSTTAGSHASAVGGDINIFGGGGYGSGRDGFYNDAGTGQHGSVIVIQYT